MDFEKEYSFKGPDGSFNEIPGYMFRTPGNHFRLPLSVIIIIKNRFLNRNHLLKINVIVLLIYQNIQLIGVNN